MHLWNFKTISKFTLLLVMGAFFFVACSQDSQLTGESVSVTDTPQGLAENDFTGEEIVAGIFFGSGNFAAELPSLKKYAKALENSPTEMQATYQEIVDGILAEIKAKDADVFTTFKASLNGGDPLVVETSLRNMGLTIQDHLKATIDKQQLKGPYEVANTQAISEALENEDYDALKREMNNLEQEVKVSFGDFDADPADGSEIASAVLVFAVAIVAVYAAYFGVVASSVGGFTHFIGAFVDRWVEINTPIISGGDNLEFQAFIVEVTTYFN